jgi:hypothetical protein
VSECLAGGLSFLVVLCVVAILCIYVFGDHTN